MFGCACYAKRKYQHDPAHYPGCPWYVPPTERAPAKPERCVCGSDDRECVTDAHAPYCREANRG